MQKKEPVNELIIVREFEAPRKLVFECFAKREHMAAWWGPAEARVEVLSMDFRPGGLFHFSMQFGDQLLWARFIYGKITEPELIEFTLSFSNKEAGTSRAPFFE